MAIHQNTYTGVYVDNHQEFTCDYRRDVEALPTQTSGENRCPMSSEAFVIEDSSKWMLNSEGVWTEIFVSGSGSMPNITIATKEQIHQLFE